MALDPRIALMGQTPEINLSPFFAGQQHALQFRGGQLALAEEQRRLAEEARIREAYRQQYGGGAPPGLAGVTPMTPPQGQAPVQERVLGGAPSAAFPAPLPPLAEQEAAATQQALYGTPPPGATSPAGAGAPGSGLAGLAGQMGGAAGGAPGQNQAFINQLYAISPQAGAVAETHALKTQELQLKNHLERVEYLGRVADGVLEAGTQEAWNIGRRMLIEAGMPPGQVPELYDKPLLQTFSSLSKDSKTKLEAARVRLAELQEGRLGRAERWAEAKAQREEREAAGGLYPYVTDSTLNAAINQAMQDAGLPRGSEPPPAVLQRAREVVTRGKEQEAAATGRQAAEARVTGETAQKRLEALDKGGLTAQDTHTTLDELDRLMDEGVYGNSPQDRVAMAAYRAGTRAGDTKAQRTARLQELGNQLVLARGSLGSNVSNTDAQIYARAAGNFQQAKNLQEMKESIKSMRTILNKAIDYANTARTTYEQTGRLPLLEGRSPYAGKAPESLTPEQAREELEWLKQRYK